MIGLESSNERDSRAFERARKNLDNPLCSENSILPNIYVYAAMIENKEENKNKRIMSIVSDIIDNDIIAPLTAEINRKRIVELRKLGEECLADAILKDYPHQF